MALRRFWPSALLGAAMLVVGLCTTGCTTTANPPTRRISPVGVRTIHTRSLACAHHSVHNDHVVRVTNQPTH